jgi:hypothetical protein
MYTPFRRNPRIFPAVVSATVPLEAVTLLFAQLVVAGCLDEASAVRCALTFGSKTPELANPAPKVAMVPMNKRRPLKQDCD